MSNESTNSTTNRGGGEGEVIPETNLNTPDILIHVLFSHQEDWMVEAILRLDKSP